MVEPKSQPCTVVWTVPVRQPPYACVPPELKVRTPAHTKNLGWYVEFESRVTHRTAVPGRRLLEAGRCEAGGALRRPAGRAVLAAPACAGGESVILLHPPLPLVGASIGMERGGVIKMAVSPTARPRPSGSAQPLCFVGATCRSLRGPRDSHSTHHPGCFA